MVFEEAGAGPARLRTAPPLGLALLALVNPTMRAVWRQRYLTERPLVADHGKFQRTFGAAPTPHREAIARTLEWYRGRSQAR